MSGLAVYSQNVHMHRSGKHVEAKQTVAGHVLPIHYLFLTSNADSIPAIACLPNGVLKSSFHLLAQLLVIVDNVNIIWCPRRGKEKILSRPFFFFSFLFSFFFAENGPEVQLTIILIIAYCGRRNN